MTKYKDAIGAVERTIHGAIAMEKSGYKCFAELGSALRDNMNTIRDFIDSGMQKYNDLERELAVEKALRKQAEKNN